MNPEDMTPEELREKANEPYPHDKGATAVGLAILLVLVFSAGVATGWFLF